MFFVAKIMVGRLPYMIFRNRGFFSGINNRQFNFISYAWDGTGFLKLRTAWHIIAVMDTLIQADSIGGLNEWQTPGANPPLLVRNVCCRRSVACQGRDPYIRFISDWIFH